MLPQVAVVGCVLLVYNAYMLNTFPFLLSFGLIAPFIIRITIGLFFLFSGSKGFRVLDGSLSQKILSVVEIIGGLFLIAGFLTQISAFFIFVISLIRIFTIRKNSERGQYDTWLYVLLAITSLSLVFAGAGFFAIDKPL